jgi:hypothetical protein
MKFGSLCALSRPCRLCDTAQYLPHDHRGGGKLDVNGTVRRSFPHPVKRIRRLAPANARIKRHTPVVGTKSRFRQGL